MTNSVKQGEHLKGMVQTYIERLYKEPNMNHEKMKQYFDEQHASRANNRQVGGDHYKSMGVEPWNVIDTWPLEQRIGAYRAGALKYLMRMGGKDEEVQEIGKGLHYLEKLLEVLKEQPEEE